jgi:rhomboid protease GluP
MSIRPLSTSLLCPSCRRLVSRDQERCPYCGLRHPGSRWNPSRLFALFANPEGLIPMITWASVAMYIISLLLNPRGAGLSASPFDFLSPSNRSLLILGATGTVAMDQLQRWWSLIAATYLHGSLLHIIFNMIALRQIGPLVINEFGGYRMLVIYTVGGIAGFLLSYVVGIRFTMGASASICALIGAALYYGKSRGGFHGDQIYRQVGGWAISIGVFGLMVPGINNWAHGGGMAGGALLGYLLGYRDLIRERPLHKVLGVGCAVLTVIILIGAAVTSLFLVFVGG